MNGTFVQNPIFLEGFTRWRFGLVSAADAPLKYKPEAPASESRERVIHGRAEYKSNDCTGIRKVGNARPTYYVLAAMIRQDPLSQYSQSSRIWLTGETRCDQDVLAKSSEA